MYVREKETAVILSLCLVLDNIDFVFGFSLYDKTAHFIRNNILQYRFP